MLIAIYGKRICCPTSNKLVLRIFLKALQNLNYATASLGFLLIVNMLLKETSFFK